MTPQGQSTTVAPDTDTVEVDARVPEQGAPSPDLRDPSELAEAHLPLVDHVVAQVAHRFPRHVDRDELRAAGAAGLVEAAHRYDPHSGVPFGRYAWIRVRGAILDATRRRDWATRRMRRDLRAIEDTASRLESRDRRAPDDAEIAAELDIEPELVRERRAAAVTSRLLTLDRSASGDEDDTTTLSDRVVEEDAAWLPQEALESEELVGTLRVAIEHLPDEPKQVLLAHHFEGRLLREIADDLGVTEARASQLRQEALHALQAYFATEFDGVPDVPTSAPGKRRRSAYVSQVAAASTWRTRLDAAEGEGYGDHVPLGMLDGEQAEHAEAGA